MGRFSAPLAPRFAGWAGVAPGMRVVDVGCGPGALTAELARLVGADRVAAADPAEQFAATCRERVPGADVRTAPAEALPFGDGAFDAALAQLVLPFLTDAAAAAAEMRRVVRPGGLVAACSWARDGMELLNLIWDAARERLHTQRSEAGMPFRSEEELRALFEAAGLREVRTALLEAEGGYDSFEDLGASVTAGAGPAGAFVARLAAGQRAALREACRERVPEAGAFALRG